MELPWRPFKPDDWFDKSSCYPCIVWDKSDNMVFTPCDPWTLTNDSHMTANWVCIPTTILVRPAMPDGPQNKPAAVRSARVGDFQ